MPLPLVSCIMPTADRRDADPTRADQRALISGGTSPATHSSQASGPAQKPGILDGRYSWTNYQDCRSRFPARDGLTPHGV